MHVAGEAAPKPPGVEPPVHESEHFEGTSDSGTQQGLDVQAFLPMGELTANTSVRYIQPVEGENSRPQRVVPPPSTTMGASPHERLWMASEFAWIAPGTYHQPLYFEEVNLERYGYYDVRPCLQPLASAAHFFGTVPLLPYKTRIDPPCQCVHTLGHYRPGSRVPHRPELVPLRADAIVAEAAAVAGVILLIP
jgi:hypothetical protein